MSSQPIRKMRRQEPILLQVSLENGANQGFFSLSTYGPARLGRYLVAFLGPVTAPEGLDPEQTYQVSYQHCSDERSTQYPCQAHNRSNVKWPIVHLVNLPFDSISGQKLVHKSFAERSISRSLKLPHDSTMPKCHHGRLLCPYLAHLLVTTEQRAEEKVQTWDHEDSQAWFDGEVRA